MRKILSITAAVTSVFVMGTAQAAVLLVDDFNLPLLSDQYTSTVMGSPITHCYYKGASGSCGGFTGQQVTGTAQAANTISAASLALQRDVTVQLTTANGNPADQTMEARVGGGPLFGSLRVQAGNGNNGIANVQWTLPSFPLPANQASYFFSVLASTVGPTAPTLASFTFAGGLGSFSTAAQSIPQLGFNAAGSPLPFAVNPADAMTLAGGGILTLNLTGGEGWSLNLDQFSFNVPEPTALALVGLALVGAGVASRRRKA